MAKKENLIMAKSYKEAKSIFRVLDNKIRIKILNILHLKGRASVKDIAEEAGLIHTVASMHLNILKKYHIVNMETGDDTRQRVYSINKSKLVGYNSLAEKVTEFAYQ